jgi:hypothetical protein
MLLVAMIGSRERDGRTMLACWLVVTMDPDRFIKAVHLLRLLVMYQLARTVVLPRMCTLVCVCAVTWLMCWLFLFVVLLNCLLAGLGWRRFAWPLGGRSTWGQSQRLRLPANSKFEFFF